MPGLYVSCYTSAPDSSPWPWLFGQQRNLAASGRRSAAWLSFSALVKRSQDLKKKIFNIDYVSF